MMLGQFASIFHWILIAVIAWMVFAGFVMRFTKVSPQFKKVLRRFHSKWYMFVIVLVLVIIAHVASLPSFPYPLGWVNPVFPLKFLKLFSFFIQKSLECC